MKLVRGISLFIVCLGLFIIGCFLGFSGHEFFYPGTSIEGATAEKKAAAEGTVKEKTSVIGQQAAVSVQDENIITADTSFIVIEVNVDDKTENAEEIPVPAYYMGMDRTEFEKQIKSQDDSPSLTELQRGFQGSEIRSFSGAQVELCKFYKSQEDEENEENEYYYLAIMDDQVVVYKADGKTIYMETDISADDLPSDILQELLQKRVVNTEEDLYTFLESYSS